MGDILCRWMLAMRTLSASKLLSGALVSLPFLVLAGGLNSTAKADDRAIQFSFPGPSSKAVSDSGRLNAAYRELPSSPDSANEYKLSIVDAGGRNLAQHTFTRSVEGAWQPNKDRVFINDYMGSTQIDCLLWGGETSGGKGFISLTKLLLSDPKSGPIEGRGSKPPETPANSRFELVCEGWNTTGDIRITLTGNTWAGGHFEYRLRFDPTKQVFNWN
jgi:hypothetical protein